MKIECDKAREIIKYLDSIDEKTDEEITLIRNILSSAQRMYYRLLPRSKKEQRRLTGRLGAIIKSGL